MTSNADKPLAKSLRRLRELHALSQQKVADDLQVATNSYSSWERGENDPRLTQLVSLADYYEVSIDALLGRASGLAHSFEEGGVKWRVGWSAPQPQDEEAAEVWRRLINGERANEDLGKSAKDVERLMQDFVIHERVCIEKVERREDMEGQLRDHFKAQTPLSLLRDVRVANIAHIDSKLLQFVLLGYVAGDYFKQEVKPGHSIGLCGGFAVSRMVYALRRGECPGGINVLPVTVSPMFEQPAISANSLVAGFSYRQYGLGVNAFHLPFYPDEAKNEPTSSVARRVLTDAANVDFLFMGVGAKGQGALALDMDDARRDYLWIAGIDPSKIQNNSTAVGNLLYYLIDEHGRQPEDFKHRNDTMVYSIGLKGLRRLVDLGKRVIVVALGVDKADVTRVAIEEHYANVLIIDDGLAQALLK